MAEYPPLNRPERNVTPITINVPPISIGKVIETDAVELHQKPAVPEGARSLKISAAPDHYWTPHRGMDGTQRGPAFAS